MSFQRPVPRGLWQPRTLEPLPSGHFSQSKDSQILGHVDLPTVGCDRVAPVFLMRGASSSPGGSRHSGARSAAPPKLSTPA